MSALVHLIECQTCNTCFIFFDQELINICNKLQQISIRSLSMFGQNFLYAYDRFLSRTHRILGNFLKHVILRFDVS